MAKINVLVVQPVAEAGGSDRALLQLVRTLPREEFDVHIALPGRSPLDDAYRQAGATLHVVPMRRVTTSGGWRWWVRYAFGWPVAVARLVRLGRRTGADVVHSNSLHSWYGWAAALLLRRPHVWHAREVVTQSGAALRLERFLTRHFATVVLCASETVAVQLPGANTVLELDDVDRDRFRPGAAGRARAALDIADDVPLVGVVSRIDTWKGIETAIDAVARSAVPGALLVIAGAPVAGKEEYADGLRERAASTGARWLGVVDDPADLVADLDVLLTLSTDPEPYGLAVVEALASGCPVVVSDHGGPTEILARAHAGAGEAVAAGDVNAAAAAIDRALARAPGSSEARRRRPVLLDEAKPRVADVYRELTRRSLCP